MKIQRGGIVREVTKEKAQEWFSKGYVEVKETKASTKEKTPAKTDTEKKQPEGK